MFDKLEPHIIGNWTNTKERLKYDTHLQKVRTTYISIHSGQDHTRIKYWFFIFLFLPKEIILDFGVLFGGLFNVHH